MIIIKVATDATVAIAIIMFLLSSVGFRLNDLSEPLLAAFVEGAETLFDAIVEFKTFVTFFPVATTIVVVVAMVVANVAVVAVAVVVVVIPTGLLGVCFAGANRVIGS